MARVYRARDKARRHDVALKAIRIDASAAPASAWRFAREAQAVAAFDHPNILPVADYGITRR